MKIRQSHTAEETTTPTSCPKQRVEVVQSTTRNQKWWDSWAKNSLIAETTMRNSQQRLRASQLLTVGIMCHRPHTVKSFQRRLLPGKLHRRRTVSHNSDFEAPTNDTMLEATPSLTNLLLVLNSSAMMQPSLLPPTIPEQPAIRRLDFARELSTWRSAFLVEVPVAHLLDGGHSSQVLHGSTTSVCLNLELCWGVRKLPEDVPPLPAFNIRVESSTWRVPIFFDLRRPQ